MADAADSGYAGRLGRVLFTDSAGLVHVALDDGIVEWFYAEELHEVQIPQ